MLVKNIAIYSRIFRDIKYPNYNQPKNINSKHNKGISLVEVVVTMLILLVGILGMLKLQGTSLKTTYSSFQRSLAAIQAQDLVERLWAGVCIQSVSATRSAIVQEWQSQHNPTLTKKGATGSQKNLQMDGWSGTLTEPSTGIYQVLITWTDSTSGSGEYKLFTSLPTC